MYANSNAWAGLEDHIFLKKIHEYRTVHTCNIATNDLAHISRGQMCATNVHAHACVDNNSLTMCARVCRKFPVIIRVLGVCLHISCASKGN